jgi:photosystem II stability/assembly factor-like uncharacterized protein
VQLHTGTCQNPSIFNEFDKALILEDAYLTNYSTEDLGALASGDNAAINESSDISAALAYEVVPISTTSRTPTLVVNEIVDAVLCDSVSCGGGACEDESTGCNKVYGITTGASGSPATIPDIVYTLDGGATWFVHDIEGVTSPPGAIECLGDYVFLTVNVPNEIAYALKSDLDGHTDPTWTLVTTGFVTSAEPNDAWSTGQYAFIVGDNGYVYGTSNPTEGVTVLDAGAATAFNLYSVHGLSETFAVAGGDNGALIFTLDGAAWSASPTSPVGIGVRINTVWVKSELNWIVGCSNGRMYYTLNQGVSWIEKAFAGSGSGSVTDVVFPTKSVGYLAHTTTAPHGRLFRTIDGGYSWKLMPEKTGTLPANDRIDALAYCQSDANVVFGVGLADDGADGFIVVGQAD